MYDMDFADFGDPYDPFLDEDEEEEPPDHHPYFTTTICVIQLLYFAFIMYMIFQKNGGGIVSLKDNPMLGPTNAQLIELGGKWVPYIIEEGEWWRLFASIFPHSGFIHLVINLGLQFSTGRFLEKEHGWWRVMIVYFLAATGGMLLSAIFLPDLVSVGTSGGVYGLMSIMLMDLVQNWKYIEAPWPNLGKQVVGLVFFLLLGLFPNVDNFMHFGGFIVGCLASLIVFPNMHLGMAKPMILIAVAAPSLCVYFLVCLIVLYSSVDPNGWCSFCLAISCININNWCDTNPLETYEAQQEQKAAQSGSD